MLHTCVLHKIRLLSMGSPHTSHNSRLLTVSFTLATNPWTECMLLCMSAVFGTYVYWYISSIQDFVSFGNPNLLSFKNFFNGTGLFHRHGNPSLLGRYEALVAAGELSWDRGQVKALQRLQELVGQLSSNRQRTGTGVSPLGHRRWFIDKVSVHVYVCMYVCMYVEEEGG